MRRKTAFSNPERDPYFTGLKPNQENNHRQQRRIDVSLKADHGNGGWIFEKYRGLVLEPLLPVDHRLR